MRHRLDHATRWLARMAAEWDARPHDIKGIAEATARERATDPATAPDAPSTP